MLLGYASPRRNSTTLTLNFLVLAIFTLTSFQSVSAKAVLDFDGDGKTDYAVLRTSNDQNQFFINWYISLSSGGSIIQQFGIGSLVYPRDKILPEDYDGDGIGDIAVYRSRSTAAVNTFYVLRSSDGTMEAMTFGKDGDFSIVADFDGDGKTDYAVYREFESGALRTMWYWIESSTGEFRSLHFGASFHERVVPGDYDGDGKTDQAVTRLEGQNIIWYVNGSTNGMTAVHWGIGSDTLVATPYF